MNVLRTCKLLVLVLAVGFAAIAPAAAQGPPAANRLIDRFYDDPRPERLAGFLDDFAKTPMDWSAYPPLAGFFAATFQRYPDWIDKLLPARFDAKTAETVVAALRLSGRPSLSPTLRARLVEVRRDAKLADEFADLPVRLEDLRIATATHLDILWGAFFATGDSRYVRMILDFFARTANRSEELAIDVTKVALAVSGGPKDAYGQVRAKYDDAALREIIFAATAQWALVSNARQHPIVKATLATYIAERPDSPAAKSLSALQSKRN